MRAVTFSRLGGPEVLELQELADPRPAAGEVLIAVRAAAVNHFDLHLREGFRFDLSFPHVLGLEMAGDVTAVGEGVDTSLVGRAVVPRYLLPTYEMLGVHRQGGYAEYVSVPAGSLIMKPDELSYEEAAGLQLAFSATWHALTTRGSLAQGETVLVTGAGGSVGIAAVQLARHRGARVIACGGNDERLRRAVELGADETVNHRDEDLAARVLELTDGAGANMVLDSVGGPILEAALKAIGYGGRIVTVGSMAGDDVKVNIPDLYLGEHALIGSLGASNEEVDEVFELARAGHVRVVIDRVVPLEEAADAHRAIEAQSVFGKVVLAP